MTTRFAVVRYPTSGPPLPAHLDALDPYELAALGGARHAAERAAAFVAIRRAAGLASGGEPRIEWSVRRRENAAPLLLLDGAPSGWPVSVAHAGGLVLVAVTAGS